ncbi:MAG: HEAT repeat domain-containing protein [Elusimicrobiota bacterium]|nr:HEAT repeat domain-containing protein [Elusimicrobiota bacterium]
MVKICRILILSAVCFTGTLRASLADDLKEDIASERPLVRRRAVYSIIHSTLPPVTVMNMLGTAALDGDLLVKRLAVSGISQFSRFFDEIYADTFTVVNVSTDIALSSFTAVSPVEKKITSADIALDILRSALNDNASVIRADAVRVLNSFPAKIVKEDVLYMLDDSSFLVVKEALRTAANLKMTEASPKAGKLLKHKSEIVRFSAAEFAGAMELQECYKQLRKLAGKDRSVQVRETALEAMIKIRPDDKNEILKDFLNRKDVSMALKAAFLLAKDSDYSGRGIVFSALESEDPGIRLNAAKTLLYYDDEESTGLFDSLCGDPDPGVRSFAERNSRRKK